MRKNSKHELSTSRWLIDLAADYSLIVLAFYIAWLWHWPAYPASILLLGIAQHRISILGHDGAHGLVSKNKKLNYWLTQVLCFWMLLSDMKAYRKFHWEHHNHTGEEGIDPELELKKGRYGLPMTPARFYGRFLLDLFGRSIPEFFEVIVYFSKRGNPLWAISFIAIFSAISYFTGNWEFFILFMVSKPTAFWAVFRLRIYHEHVSTPMTHRVHLALWQRFLFAPHYVWIHWEHHKNPYVPYWKLPVLRLQYKEEPVISFTELLRYNGFQEELIRRNQTKQTAIMPEQVEEFILSDNTMEKAKRSKKQVTQSTEH